MKQLNLFIDATAVPAGKLLGKFPAHVVDVEVGEERNGARPYNLVFEIAPEAAGYTGKDSETGEERSGEELVGQKLRSVGIWLNYHPKEGWENRKYVVSMEALGIEFPTTEDGKKQIIELESEDLMGLPAIVETGFQKNNKTGRSYYRILKLYKWEDGVPKSIVNNILGDI